MYEESVAVPLIATGPGLPAGQRVSTPTSLLDLYPFILEAVGAASPETVTPAHPGISIAQLMSAPISRIVFSEYHGMGSKTAAYMVRKGPYKLVYYADYAPQLFNLGCDPEERNDIAGQVDARHTLEELKADLWRICAPDEINRRAKADQQRLLAAVGGKTYVIDRGDLGFSPPPGVPAQFS
jgi:choline-sulfatase